MEVGVQVNVDAEVKVDCEVGLIIFDLVEAEEDAG